MCTLFMREMATCCYKKVCTYSIENIVSFVTFINKCFNYENTVVARTIELCKICLQQALFDLLLSQFIMSQSYI